MSKENLEVKCKKAVLGIASNVKDINQKLTHFLENYRKDYYKTMDGTYYKKLYD